MKHLLPLLLLVLGLAPLIARAAEPGPEAETHIASDSVEFDMKTRLAVYRGNVTVTDPRIALTCEFLTAKVLDSGQVERIVAETNVVATIVTNNTTFTVTAAKATYTYQVSATATNQTLELTGLPAPKITWPQEDVSPPRTNEFTARRILWDLANERLTAEEHRGVFPDFQALRQRNRAATNAPPAAQP
ncbi:MAG: LptA/OstA family protein [Limisphaerales bacterium]